MNKRPAKRQTHIITPLQGKDSHDGLLQCRRSTCAAPPRKPTPTGLLSTGIED